MKKRKIVLNPIGGLANRMRSIVAGLTLARESGRDYEVVWAVNEELAAKMDDIFMLPEDLNSKIIYPSALSYKVKYSIPRRKNLYITALTLRRYSKAFFDAKPPLSEMMEHSDTPLREIARNPDIDTIFVQSGTIYHPLDKEFYRSIFKLNPEMQSRVDRAVELLGQDYIGLHIRRTDNIMARHYSPDSLFMDKMDEILQINPDAKFYLATDSDKTKMDFVGKYGNRTVISSPRSASRTSLDGIKDAVAEMFILANASKIYGSFYSSFSEAAAIIGNTPLTQLYKP